MTKYVYLLANTTTGNLVNIYTDFNQAKKIATAIAKRGKDKYGFEWDNYGDISIYKVKLNNDTPVDLIGEQASVWNSSSLN